MLYYWINNWIYYLLFPSGSLIIAYSIVNILHCQYKNHAVMHYMWVMNGCGLIALEKFLEKNLKKGLTDR